jgi:transcriptional regulator with XRE-family HTH domain
MARKLKNPLPPVTCNIGKRLADVRKVKGLTQTQLADLIGVKQYLISDYEVGRLALSADMLTRFCSALKYSADAIIGLKPESNIEKHNLRLSRRIKSIEQLPANQQKALLQNIDMFLKGAKRA